MTLQVKTGRISIPTGAALRTFTGVGFRGKAIIFKLTQVRTVDDLHEFDNDPIGIGFGFASGPGENFCWFLATSSTTTFVMQARSETKCIMVAATAGGAVHVEASFDSWTDDGFVLDVTLGTLATYVDYIVFGGSDVTGAKAFAFNEPTTTGNFPVTGLGIEPTLVVFGDGWNGTSAEMLNNVSSSSTRAQLSFVTEAASVSMVAAVSPRNSSNNTIMTSLRTDNKALVTGAINSTTPLALATLASMDVGGFTLNYSVAPAGGTRRCGIAIAGSFLVACGAVTEPASVGDVEVSLDFTPVGGLLMSQGRASSTTMFGNTTNIEIDNSWGLWAATGGHYTSAWSAYQGTGAELLSGKVQNDTFEVLEQVTTTTASVRSRLTLSAPRPGIANFDFDTVSGSTIEVAYLLFGSSFTASNAANTYLDLTLPMTDSAYMAQRLAYRKLLEGQRQRFLSLIVNLRAIQWTVGDVLTVTLPDLDINAETFRITSWRSTRDPGRIELGMIADDASAYVDPTSAQYVAPPTSTEPEPGAVQVPPPTALSATATLEGIQLSWTAPDNLLAVHHYAIYSDTDSSWAGATLIGTTLSTTFLHALATSGARWYWVRAVNSGGSESIRSPDSDTSTITATFTAGTTAVPSSPQSLGGIDGTPASGNLTGSFTRAGTTVASRVFTATHSGGNLTYSAGADSGEATTHSATGSGTPTLVVTHRHTGSGQTTTLTFTVAP